MPYWDRLLAHFFYRIGKYDQAEQYANNGLKINPKESSLHNELGNAYDGQGKYKDAESEYKTAITNAGSTNSRYTYYYNLCLTLNVEKHYSEAQEAADQATKLNPDNPSGWRELGINLYFQMKYDTALSSLQKANTLNAKDKITYYYLAYTYMQLKRKTEAETAARQAIAIDNKYSPAYDALGDTLYYENEYEKAIAAYKSGSALSSDVKNRYIYLCRMEIVTGY